MEVNFKFDVGDTAYYFNSNSKIQSGEIESISFKKSQSMSALTNHTCLLYQLKNDTRAWNEDELYSNCDDIIYNIRKQFSEII